MKIQIISRKFWWFLFLCVCTSCTGADGRVPSLDVFGSYFPAWLISLAVGIILTIFVGLTGRVLKITPFHFLGPILWVSLILVFSIAVWFLFYAT